MCNDDADNHNKGKEDHSIRHHDKKEGIRVENLDHDKKSTPNLSSEDLTNYDWF